MIGGGRGDWFDIILALLAVGIALPSSLLSLIGTEYWKQTKKMVLITQAVVFVAYFLFSTTIHFSLDEDYGRLMIPIIMVIFVKMAYSLVNRMIGYDDDSPY